MGVDSPGNLETADDVEFCRGGLAERLEPAHARPEIETAHAAARRIEGRAHIAAEKVADLALGERAAGALLDETQGDHPLRLRGMAGGAGDGAQVQGSVRQPGRMNRHGGRMTADAGRADLFGVAAALHIVGAVAIRAQRGVEVIAGRAGLAVHAPAVGGKNLRVAGAARRAGERREALLRRHLVGAVAVGAPRSALDAGAQQREVHAPLGLAHLVVVAAGAGAGGRDGAIAVLLRHRRGARSSRTRRGNRNRRGRGARKP